MQEQKTYRVEVSAKTIIFTVTLILILALLWALKNLLLSLFVAFIIMSAVRPLISFFVRKGIPRRLAVFGIFIAIIFFFIFILVWVIPPFVQETTLLIKHLPAMIKSINPAVIGYINIDSLSQYAPNITNQIFGVVRVVFSNIMFVVTTLFFSFYLTLEEGFIKNTLSYFLNRLVITDKRIYIRKGMTGKTHILNLHDIRSFQHIISTGKNKSNHRIQFYLSCGKTVKTGELYITLGNLNSLLDILRQKFEGRGFTGRELKQLNEQNPEAGHPESKSNFFILLILLAPFILAALLTLNYLMNS